MLLCIDIGNTHTHYGVVSSGPAQAMDKVPTRRLDHVSEGLGPRIVELQSRFPSLAAIAFCSVVPDASERLVRFLERQFPQYSVFQLTYEKRLGVPIGYPRPAEIGQDRLANAAGAQALFGAPVIVIDVGTAVTFDIVTKEKGYEGGIIAPGVDVMRRYLHEQTALLPAMDDSLEITHAIGQSTVDAMRIGTVIGFGGMIQALLDAVLAELAARGSPAPRILATGGTAGALQRGVRTPFEVVPDITLQGLAFAWNLNR